MEDFSQASKAPNRDLRRVDKLQHFPGKETDPEQRDDLEGARKDRVGLRKNWITGHFLFLIPSKTSLAYSIVASALARDETGYRKIPQWAYAAS